MKNNLHSVAQLESPDWVRHKGVQHILRILNGADSDHPEAMIVGGAIRNHVLGTDVKDVDIATTHRPEDVLRMFKDDRKVTVFKTGIDHGTLTLRCHDRSFEVTSLRKDVATDGRRAVVAFSVDWAEDAQRRDFTMNALYMDAHGSIYDPTGEGWRDLERRNVRFIGDAEQRIKEDALRILRFFRFWSYYSIGEPDSEALQACSDHAGLIKNLSKERVTSELLKILMAPRVSETLCLMVQNKILPEFLLHNIGLNFDININMLSRLFWVICKQGKSIADLRNIIVLSNADWRFLQDLECLHKKCNPAELNKKKLRVLIYKYNENIIGQFLYLNLNGLGEKIDNLNHAIVSWECPKFPVTGDDLKALGFEEGKALGENMKKLEKKWIESDFTLSKSELLRSVKR